MRPAGPTHAARTGAALELLSDPHMGQGALHASPVGRWFPDPARRLRSELRSFSSLTPSSLHIYIIHVRGGK